MQVRVLTKKGRLKEALAASMKKVNLIEELEDELLQQVEISFDKSYYDQRLYQLPWALLDFCELAAVNRTMEEKRGFAEESEAIILGKEVEDVFEDKFRGKAVALAATFGDSSVHKYDQQPIFA